MNSTTKILSKSIVECLFKSFNQQSVLYCHWKSNVDLAHAVSGKLDLDILVDRTSLAEAVSILRSLGFKKAVAFWGSNSPSISHYYHFDPFTDQFIHVHLFSQVITGESLIKSHHLPFERMLLENTYSYGPIKVVSKAAELVLFISRTFIKYSSFPDLLRLYKNPKKVREELDFLKSGGGLSKTLDLLNRYCPVLDEKLFLKCIESIENNDSLMERVAVGWRVRRRLKPYAKYTFLGRYWAYFQLAWAEIRRSIGGRRKNKILDAGGSMIAFIGADATGKSTLVFETKRWLGDIFVIRSIHAGKPPSSLLTVPINFLLYVFRRLRKTRSKETISYGEVSFLDRKITRADLIYALRAVALAWDRRNLLCKSRRMASKGEIVVSDRYPSRKVGAMDSPRLHEISLGEGFFASLYNYLARLEAKLYNQIPPPNIALKLKVSIETAKERNRARDSEDEEGYLETRHKQSLSWEFSGTEYVCSIDTEQSLENTILEVKNAIWESL